MKPAFVLAACAVLLVFSMTTNEAQRKGGGNSPFGEFHKNQSLAVGQPAPRLFAQDTEGKEVDLRDYLGQWVFIEFGSYT